MNKGPNYDGLIVFGILIPKDKIAHFIAGFFFSLLVYTFTKGNVISSLSATLALGIAKELYDAYILKNWADADIFDVIATFLGGSVGLFIIYLLQLFNRIKL